MMLKRVYSPTQIGFQEAYSTEEMCEIAFRPIINLLQNKKICCPCDSKNSAIVKWLKKNTNSEIINFCNLDVTGDKAKEKMLGCLVITDPPFDPRVLEPFVEWLLETKTDFLILSPYYNYDYRTKYPVFEYKCQDSPKWRHTLIDGSDHYVTGRWISNKKLKGEEKNE